MAEKKLYRSESDRILGGVCGGIAEVYGYEPSLVRLVAIILAFTQIGIPVYIAAWIIIPSESELEDE